MEPIANMVKHFILRDLIFTLAGGVLALSGSYAIGELPSIVTLLGGLPWLLQAACVGAAWALGYALYDGVLGLVLGCAGHVRNPSKATRWLFRRFVGRSWKQGDEGPDGLALANRMDELIQESFGPYHRTVLLRHLGGAVGLSFLMSGVIVYLASNCQRNQHSVALAVAAILVGVVLIALGRMKALQQTDFAARHMR